MYYLGLDMGTNSVGWAVTDKNYVLLRAKGKDLWGIREFEIAETAVERRTHRISRRRRQREVARIGLIKSYFEDAVLAEDPYFYIRMDNSKYFMEDKDKRLSGKNCLFEDEDYCDADYYKQFPTIYHLRKALIRDEIKDDKKYARLVYLAVLNLFKRRGHFLDASISDKTDERSGLSEAYARLIEKLDKITDNEFCVSLPKSPDYSQLEKVLANRKISKTKKTEELLNIMEIDKKDKISSEMVKAICGREIDAKKMFPIKDVEESIKINFSSESFDENCAIYQQLLGEDYFDVIESLKEIYDIGALASILGDFTFLSEARVFAYEKHKSDLKLLKKVMRKYNSDDEYNNMFRSEADNSYSSYVKSYNSGVKGRRTSKGRTRSDLYDAIKKVSKSWDQNDSDVDMILTQIDSESFLIKQLSFENGVIPNQVHAKELRKILDNAQKRLPFLNEKDESGLTVSERIFSLYTFHIPYYIGPVSSKSKENKGNGWVIRKNSGRVFPWNLEEKIDIAETSKEFIEKMVRRCTYIEGEMCLPKDSLMYQKYCVLNEINNIRINDERISVELKQDIYNDLFKKGKRVTRKALCKYLANRGLLKEETQLSGIDTNINSCLASYGKFQRIFGDDIDKDSCKCVVEDIIYLSTIYGDDKKLLKNKLIDKYSEILDQTAIKTILGYKFKDWGRLSKEFLELEGTDENGEIMSLISAMWNTNYNMMELINSDNFYFKQALADKQNKALKLLESFEAEDLDEYYFSAPVKRMIWQTLKIIKELKEVLGEYPDRIFIEMTRSEEEKGDKGRKDSRKKMFLDLYKKVKDENNNWAKIIEDADKSGKIRSKKMFLYLTQMGRCMYTGNPIDLDRLFTPDYDIDHIYPRSQVKDDNLSNNLVLVEKKSNADKSDVYPLDVSIRNNDKVRNHWKMLREKKLITDEKYKRLTGINPFTDDQRADFIARQLVETSQGTKGVADLLKQLLPDTTIVYVKSRNVSDFRNENDMLKSRVVNDFHHANDAYLNIVVGNVYFTKFTQNPKNFIEKEFRNNKNKNHYNLSKMYSWDVVRNGETAWIAKKDGNLGTIQTVRKMMSKNTPLMTRMSFERHGSIANETLYSAKDAKKNAYIPFKSSDSRLADVEKYGGFTKVSTAYLFLVEHEDKKGKRIRTLETVPIIFSKKIGNDISLLLKYCKENLGLINPDIRIPKINMQSLIKKNGYEFYISGKTENRYVVKNAVNLKISYEWVKYIKELEKVTMSENIIADSDEKITIANNVALYDILTKKHSDGIFAKRPNPVGDKLQEGKEKFLVLSLLEQAKLLMQILNLNVIGNTKADLSAIGQSKDSGVMLISKKISEEDNIYLVNQSVTGIYEKYIDLLTV